MLRLRWTFIGSDLILLFVLGLFVVYVWGGFAYADTLLRDFLNRVSGARDNPSHVLLVDGTSLQPEALDAFVDAVAKRSPAGILFYVGMTARQRQWRASATPLPEFPLYFFAAGQTMMSGEGELIRELPAAPYLHWQVSPPEHGISRYFRPADAWLGVVGLSARYASQKAFEPSVFAAPVAKGLAINFSRAAEYLPLVSAERALTDDLLAKMVAGRWVLVGLDSVVMRPSLTTPLSAPHASVSQLAFEGYGLNSLFSDSGSIRVVPSAAMLLLLVSLALFNVFFLQALNTVWAVLANIGVLTVLIIGSALILMRGIWVPPTAFVLNQVICFLVIREHARAQSHGMVEDMQADLSHQITDKLLPPNFYAQENAWRAITMLLTQQCDLRRCILLERLPNQQRLREVESVNCTFEDIAERRRDYGREPYLSAMSAKGVVRTNRPYFKSKTDDEHEYIAPLIFDATVEGFWAFTIDEAVEQSGKLDWTVINSFAQEIAELMFHHKQWHMAAQRDANWALKLLRMQADQSNFQTLKKSVKSMERRLTVLEDVFNNMVTSAVLYNLFGQVIKANAQLETLARTRAFPLYNRSALDTLSTLCELPTAKARDCLYRVTVCGEHIALPASALGGDASYMLHVRAISMENATTGPNTVAAPFRILGVLFELIDTLDINYNIQLVEDLNYQLIHQIRNNLSAMGLALRQQRKVTGGEQPSIFSQMIGNKIDETGKLLNEIQSFQETSRLGDDTQVLPLDVVRIFKRVLARFYEPISEKSISVASNMPEHYSLGLVSRGAIEHFYAALISLFIEDAAPQSEIRVSIESCAVGQQPILDFAAHNQGVGVTRETITQLFGDVSHVYSDKLSLLEKLIFFARLLQAMGCSVEISSDVGRGYEVRLRITALNLDRTESDAHGKQGDNQCIIG